MKPKADSDIVVKKTGWTEWFHFTLKHKHVCCGCLMEHYVEQRIVDGQVQERWKRDPKATANNRRKK